MKKYWLGCCFYAFLSSAFANSQSQTVIGYPTHTWNGFYLGVTGGAVYSDFNTQSATQAGSLFNIIEANAINNAGTQKISSNGFIAGFEGGYNWQFKYLLLGLEAGLQSLSLNGTTNSGAIIYPNQPSKQFVITSYANNNWLFSAMPRIGMATSNWLFFVEGGLGLTLLQSDFAYADNNANFESQKVNQIKAGYVLGAGIETGLTDHVSLKAEYRFANFNHTNAQRMYNIAPKGQPFSNGVNFKENILQLGLNYHFNNTSKLFDTPWTPDVLDLDQWQVEMGVRAFASTGTIGAPQPLLNSNGTMLISRLMFNDLTAFSEEVFARFDHANGFFTKGYWGAGTVTNGQLIDEDFPAGGAYSHTSSGASGNLNYANIDLGYSFIQSPLGKIGAFVGYNYYAQNINAYGCNQLAGAAICRSGILNDFIGLSEDDNFNSLRVGVTTQFDITDKLNLTAETAYLPAIGFEGQDNHNARQLIGPEQASRGSGAMLESVLNYRFNPSWNVGLGARYWAWNTQSGSVSFNFLGVPGPYPSEKALFNTERYGVFLQLSYVGDKKLNPIIVTDSPVDWTGLFMGGQLGGGWSQSAWSDPFGSTISSQGYTNVSGFGDNVRATGPLGGVTIYSNWHLNRWVYGVGASLSMTDIRGQDTLFSGIGGINGQTSNNYLGTITGKIGTTVNRSLFYILGGSAALNTTFKLNGNTGILNLGAQNQTETYWGWVVGAGVEYALTNHWTSSLEYNYINIPPHTVSFPAIELINTNHITVHESMNAFKLGLNYKFDIYK